MPKVLEGGIVYFSEEYGTAAHLCACGCGAKIRTPIGPIGWSIEDGPRGVSLSPSVGNWQRPCRSHYWITEGEVVWSGQWTDKQVQAGREREAAQRAAYYAARRSSNGLRGMLLRLWRRLFG
jgi:hypothetical protein